jgi:CubicO group peptidase (beta-lactamase class C family)
VADVIPPPPFRDLPGGAQGMPARTLGNPPIRAEISWTEPWRRAEIPAANGHGNARSVAVVQSVLAGAGGPASRGLISAKGCEAVFEEQSYGKDLVLDVVLRLGVGYGLMCPETPLSPSARACFWGGWGGSVVVADLERHMVVAYVMNRMGEGTTGDLRGAGLVFAANAAIAAAA